jgi:hypothetical protein
MPNRKLTPSPDGLANKIPLPIFAAGHWRTTRHFLTAPGRSGTWNCARNPSLSRDSDSLFRPGSPAGGVNRLPSQIQMQYAAPAAHCYMGTPLGTFTHHVRPGLRKLAKVELGHLGIRSQAH